MRVKKKKIGAPIKTDGYTLKNKLNHGGDGGDRGEGGEEDGSDVTLIGFVCLSREGRGRGRGLDVSHS